MCCKQKSKRAVHAPPENLSFCSTNKNSTLKPKETAAKRDSLFVSVMYLIGECVIVSDNRFKGCVCKTAFDNDVCTAGNRSGD